MSICVSCPMAGCLVNAPVLHSPNKSEWLSVVGDALTLTTALLMALVVREAAGWFLATGSEQ